MGTCGTHSAPRRITVGGALLALLLLCAQHLTAQSASPPTTVYGIWCAGTLGNGHIFGFARDRRLTVCTADFSHPFFRVRGISIRYKAAITPLAILREPARFAIDSTALTSARKSVYGAGGSPVGIRFERTGGRFRPFLESMGGFLYFADRVLSPQASRFNFTIDVAPGLSVPMGRSSALSFGFRYHHLSNANISNHNPGVDSQMLFAAWNFGR